MDGRSPLNGVAQATAWITTDTITTDFHLTDTNIELYPLWPQLLTIWQLGSDILIHPPQLHHNFCFILLVVVVIWRWFHGCSFGVSFSNRVIGSDAVCMEASRLSSELFAS
jgi:hypothetical protein